MKAIAEIDQAGRLLVPEQLRDALHLTPGTQVSLHREGDAIVIRHVSPSGGLIEIDGLLVHHSAAASAVGFNLLKFIEQERDEHLLHLGGQPSAE